jgi:hypothetical protein
VVEPHERARRVQVVAPRQPLDVLHVVEELIGEPEWILDAHRVADAFHIPLGPTLHPAPELRVEGDRAVEVLRTPHPVAERRDRRHRPLPQHQVVVDELLEAAQVDGVLVLLRDHEVEDVDVELPARGEIRDDDLHVRTAEDVRRGGGGRRDAVHRHGDRVGGGHDGLGRRRGDGVRHDLRPC